MTDIVTDEINLLGGAFRKKTRVRGFAPWSPQPDTQQVLGLVQGVLYEYRYNLPLTVRQIFYRLVGAHCYEKTEQAYERLSEHLNRARRARIISMDAIRDDSITVLAQTCYRDASDFLDTVRWRAERMELDHSAGQKTRLVVICEAAGMGPQIARVTNPFGLSVYPGGGFESTTAKHEFARQLVDQHRPTEVLDIGDHDASGVHRYLAFAEDIKAFARDLGGDVRFTRLASRDTASDRALQPANRAAEARRQAGLSWPDVPSRSTRAE
jgi:hypothetical protein